MPDLKPMQCPECNRFDCVQDDHPQYSEHVKLMSIAYICTYCSCEFQNDFKLVATHINATVDEL